MESVNVGIIGLGTVGTGVYKLLTRNAKLVEKKVGCPVRVVKVADIDTEREREVQVPRDIMTRDAREVIGDPSVHIVVELIGGTTTAGEYIAESARAGKCVVTANKALLAERGRELIPLVEEAGVEVGFEASVAGSIPVLKSIRESLAGNRIKEIFGIINGTSNYILSKMSEGGEEFGDVLREAQMIGLAEADPTLDVDGVDSAHKLAILIWLATGSSPDFEEIYIEGIREITPLDFEFAREFGYEVKLLAIAKMEDGQVEARVHPTMIPKSHLLATVGGAFNAIYVTGDFSGPVLLFGSGAGMDPTASAVVGDIIDISRNLLRGVKRRIPFSGFEKDGSGLKIKRMEDIVSEYYLRFIVIDKPGVLSKISGVLGKNNISISSVIQKGRKKEEDVPIVILTHEAREKDLRDALHEIDNLDVVLDRSKFIRIENKL